MLTNSLLHYSEYNITQQGNDFAEFLEDCCLYYSAMSFLQSTMQRGTLAGLLLHRTLLHSDYATHASHKLLDCRLCFKYSALGLKLTTCISELPYINRLFGYTDVTN